MAHVIQLGYSNTSGQTPNTLAGGEVGVNTSNRKVWVGNGSGNTLVFNHADYAASNHNHSGVYAPASANASQTWVTSNFSNNAGDITGVTAGTGMTGGGTSGGVTLNCSITDTHRAISDSISESSSTISASKTAVKAAYDRTWPNTQLSTAAVRGKISASGNSQYNSSTGVITSTNTTYTLAGLGGVTSAYVLNQIDNLVDSAPGALNTLNELAAALGDDANYASTITTALAGKSGTGHTHSVAAGQFSQQNFTTTLKNKLDGIATSANNYSFPYSVAVGAGSSTIVQRHADGYIYCNYLNITPNDIASGSITSLVAESGNDGWTRHAKKAPVLAFLNVADGATNTNATDQNFTTTLKNKLDGIASGAQVNTTHTTNTWRSISDVVNSTSSSVGASSQAAKTAYDRSWPNTWRGISNSVSTVDATTSASSTAVKDAYDRSWPNTTYSEGDHGLTQANFTDVLRTKLNAIAASANNYSFPYTVSASESASTVAQRNGSGYFHASYFNGSGTFSTGDAGAAMGMFTGTNGSDTYGRSYNAARARTLLNVADGATATNATDQNFTTTLKNKLDGIASGAQVNTTHTTDTWRGLGGTSGVGHRGDHGVAAYNHSIAAHAPSNANYSVDTNTWRGLGETSSTGYRGDRGKTAYDHSQTSHAPSNANYSVDTNTWRAIGSTSSTSMRGDHGTTAYNHSIAAHAPSNANNYSHPTGAGNNHIPSGGASGKFLKWSSSGVATWEYDGVGVFSISAGNGLTGGVVTGMGTFAVNGSSSVTSTSVVTIANSNAAKIAYDRSWPNTWRGISNSVSTVDAATSASLTAVRDAYNRSWPNTTYSASTGLYMSGTDIRHSDTSSQATSNNSGQVFIQDITLDGYGHVTAIGTATASGGGGSVSWNDLGNISALASLP